MLHSISTAYALPGRYTVSALPMHCPDATLYQLVCREQESISAVLQVILFVPEESLILRRLHGVRK